jgi:hypothetical protein
LFFKFPSAKHLNSFLSAETSFDGNNGVSKLRIAFIVYSQRLKLLREMGEKNRTITNLFMNLKFPTLNTLQS